MAEFRPPSFGEEPRQETKGEAQQRLASLLTMALALPFIGITLTKNERESLADVVGAVMRAYPQLKEFAK